MFFFTRLFFISIIIFAFSSNLVSKYDLSSDILLINNTHNSNSINIFEKITLKFLSYFSSYDAIHFILISKHDYFNDSIFAFFLYFLGSYED